MHCYIDPNSREKGISKKLCQAAEDWAIAHKCKYVQIDIFTSNKVSKIEKSQCAKVTLESGDIIEADKVLVSIGRKPSMAGLDLESLGIKTENGVIKINE